jgi:uncharacterized membrane protein YqhA
MAIKTPADPNLMWYVIIHMVFVFSSVLLAISDRIAASGNGHAHGSETPAAEREEKTKA